MKKSYHSSDVPIRLAAMTRRTDDAGAVAVWGWVGDIGPPRSVHRSGRFSRDRPGPWPGAPLLTHPSGPTTAEVLGALPAAVLTRTVPVCRGPDTAQLGAAA